jgi:hypothetical protein
VGGRIFYNGMFGVWSHDGSDLVFTSTNNGFGIGGFFDATYVEIGLDFIFGSYENYSYIYKMKSTQFGFSLLGKYPFAVKDLTVFPLVGIDYQIFISGEAYGITVSHDDWYDVFSFAVGGGLDYNLSSKLYLRSELLLNIKLKDIYESELIDVKIYVNDDRKRLTLGPRVSIGVGYKF